MDESKQGIDPNLLTLELPKQNVDPNKLNLDVEIDDEGGVLDDIVTGLSEAPSQVLGGAADAVEEGLQSAGSAGDTVGNFMESTFGIPHVGIGFNREGDFGIHHVSEFDKTLTDIDLPSTDEAESVTGGFVRSVSQFITGFLGTRRILRRAGTKTPKTAKGKVAEAYVSGAGADALFFDPKDSNLSNLLNEYPALEPIVPDYLNANPDDSEAEARFKKALEGLALGGMTDALFKTIKGMRSYRQASSSEEATQALEEAADKVEEALKKPEAEPAAAPATPTPRHEQPFMTPEQHTEIRESLRKIRETDGDVSNIEGIDFNFARMTSEDSVKDAINELSTVLGDQIDEATGGVRGFKATQEMADILGEKPDVLYQKLGHAFESAKQLDSVVVASKVMMQNLTKKTQELAKVVDDPRMATPEKEVELIQHLEILSQVTSMFKGLQTNIARAQSAQRILTGIDTNLLDNMDIDEVLNGVGGRDKLRKLAKRLSTAENPKQFVKIAHGGWAGKVIDMHNEYWINSILSGPKTHIVNMTSNALQTLMVPMERMAGAAMTLDARGMAEGAAMYRGMMASLWDSIKLSGKALKQGDNVLDPAHQVYDAPKFAISGANLGLPNSGGLGVLGQVVDSIGTLARIPSRLLLTEDEFFKQLNYRAKVRSMAMSEGLSQGLKGKELAKHIEDAVENSVSKTGEATNKTAMQYSRELTFTNDLEGGIGQSVQKFVGKHPTMRVVMPFIRTPTNLLRQVWHRTPLLGQFHFQWQQDFLAGGARRQQALGKLATGVAAYTVASDLASQDRLTGRGPADHGQRKQLEETGWLPYSFVTIDDEGNKKYIQYKRLDPMGMILGLTADFVSVAGELSEEERDESAVGMVLASIASNLSEKSYLQGLSEFIDVIESGDEKKVERFLVRRAGSYVPYSSAMSQMNDDPYRREIETWQDSMMSKVPGYSETLPPRRNIFGEKITYPAGWGPDIISPFAMSEHKDDVVADELAKLGKRFSLPPEEMDGIDLREFKNDKGQDAYDRFLEIHGELGLKDALEELVTSPGYQELPESNDEYDSARLDAVRKTIQRHRKEAKSVLFEEFEALREQVYLEKQKKRAYKYGGQDEVDALLSF